MKYALFSDLHNSEAGLADLQNSGLLNRADQVICLGDVINANNAEASLEYFNKIEAICDVILQGNHEAVLVHACDENIFNTEFAKDIKTARERLQAIDPAFLVKLKSLKPKLDIDGASLTHASFDPAHPWMHVRYIEQVKDQQSYLPNNINILAHGHVPYLAWYEDGLWYYQRDIYNQEFTLQPSVKYLVNTGSVLGSREMRAYERTIVLYDSSGASLSFYNLAQKENK